MLKSPGANISCPANSFTFFLILSARRAKRGAQNSRLLNKRQLCFSSFHNTNNHTEKSFSKLILMYGYKEFFAMDGWGIME